MLLKGTVFSKTLQMDTGITILVPNRFDSSRPYKIAYLLHGICGNSSDWADYTMLPHYANGYNVIFVMPSAHRSFYSDMKYGFNFFEYIISELPDICKKVFNISSERKDTAVMGNSMGGYGALKAALAYPEKYGYCCAFSSGALFMKDWLEDFRSGKIPGDPFINDMRACFGEDFKWTPGIELLELAKKASQTNPKTKIYSACGTNDWLHGINTKFSEEMRKLDLDFTYEEWDGAHDWEFFNEAIFKALKFCFAENGEAGNA